MWSRAVAAVVVLCQFAAGAGIAAEAGIMRPQIDGDWWQIAGNPDLGELTGPDQQPVDFSIWQAADGTWQLLSCIRHTRCGGKTRLLYRWEGRNITDAHWKPMGIGMQADPSCGETPGGLQAPHVVRLGDLYHMFYGDWVRICLATGRDGKNFTRVLDEQGKTGLFGEGPDDNARDPMLLKVGGRYFCYYTAHPGKRGAVYCRTSPDLRRWSDARIVAAGGRAGDGPWSAECPHVVFLSDSGQYYLFRTQRYGANAQTSVYCSKDPLDFGVNDDRFFVCTLPVAAPEIVLHQGEYYIAALLPSLKGIQVARLKWLPQ